MAQEPGNDRPKYQLRRPNIVKVIDDGGKLPTHLADHVPGGIRRRPPASPRRTFNSVVVGVAGCLGKVLLFLLVVAMLVGVYLGYRRAAAKGERNRLTAQFQEKRRDGAWLDGLRKVYRQGSAADRYWARQALLNWTIDEDADGGAWEASGVDATLAGPYGTRNEVKLGQPAGRYVFRCEHGFWGVGTIGSLGPSSAWMRFTLINGDGEPLPVERRDFIFIAAAEQRFAIPDTGPEPSGIVPKLRPGEQLTGAVMCPTIAGKPEALEYNNGSLVLRAPAAVVQRVPPGGNSAKVMEAVPIRTPFSQQIEEADEPLPTAASPGGIRVEVRDENGKLIRTFQLENQ